MGFVSIENVRALPDPQRAYKWNMVITRFPGGFGDADRLNIQCYSARTPDRGQEPIEINSHGHKVKYHGRAVYNNSLDLQTNETQDSYIKDFLHFWQEKHWETNTGKQHDKADLEVEVALQLLDGMNNLVSTYRLIGGWVENVTGSDLTGDGQNIQISFTLSWDYYKFS